MKLWEKIKKALKPSIDVAEANIETQDETLEQHIKNLLDINKDGILSKDDFIDLMKKFVDTNGDGKVSIWEYIALFVRVRKILKQYAK